MLVHTPRTELEDRPIAALAVAGKEVQLGETAGRARRLFTRHAVKAVPVLEGATYVGAVDAASLVDAADGDPVDPLVRGFLPVTVAETPAREALDLLDRSGQSRLVVVEDSGAYVGIVCLRGDRESLCVDPDRLGTGAEGERS